MAVPNNGVVAGPVRIVVLDTSGPARGNGTLWDNALDLVLAALAEERSPAELRVYREGTGELLARSRFADRKAADRARRLLVGLVDGTGTDAAAIDWPGELARLGGATP